MQCLRSSAKKALQRAGAENLVFVSGYSSQPAQQASAVVKSLRSKTSTNEVTVPGQAFLNDTRSTCGVGIGDGISNHTAKWYAADESKGKTPIEYCQSAEPIKVHGLTVACTGVDGEGGYSLGAPVQYISLKGTSRESPAVCKYTGRKYYSEDWRYGGGH